jgi:hypothetical protein
MTMNDTQRAEVETYVDSIVSTENLSYDQIIDNAEYLDELQVSFEYAKTLTQAEFNDIIKALIVKQKEKEEPESEIILPSKDTQKNKRYTPQRKEIVITNAYNSQPRPISDSAMITASSYQLNIMPFDEKKFELLLQNAEKMIVASHLKYLKFGRFLSSEFYIDVICTCLNIQVKFDYTYDTIPITNELKVTAYCTIYDSSRNVCVSGVSASEFMIKNSKSDEEDGNDEIIRDDHQVIETAQTRSLRRAMLYVVPTIIAEKVMDMIEQRFYPEKWKARVNSQLKPQNTAKTTNASGKNTNPIPKQKMTKKADAIKGIR